MIILWTDEWQHGSCLIPTPPSPYSLQLLPPVLPLMMSSIHLITNKNQSECKSTEQHQMSGICTKVPLWSNSWCPWFFFTFSYTMSLSNVSFQISISYLNSCFLDPCIQEFMAAINFTCSKSWLRIWEKDIYSKWLKSWQHSVLQFA